MRIRSLKHKQLIALVLIALTPLFALTASMWMQAQNSKEQAVQTYQGYADTIAIALEKELDRQKERLEEAAVAAGLLFSSLITLTSGLLSKFFILRLADTAPASQ